MGELVEAVAFVPRQIDFSEQAGKAASEFVVVDQVLTKGELFEKLVARSPTADIEIGGVPVSCVLDTGAETSLIPASFYHEHLTGMVKGLQSVGTFIKIVGVNDLDVVIEGYLDVPISIFGQTIMASFFVKSDSASSSTGRRAKSPVILGCNILRAIAEKSIKPVGPSEEDWHLALRWIRFESGLEPTGCDSLTSRQTTQRVPATDVQERVITAETTEVVTIPHGELIVVRCRLSVNDLSLEGRPMLVQTVDSDSVHLCMIEGIQHVKDGMVEVVMANTGPEPVTFPVATTLVSVQEVAVTDQVVILPSSEALNVSVQPVVVESGGEAPLPTPDLLVGDQVQTDEPASCPGIFQFPDGSRYTLPPGLCLDGLASDDAMRVAALVRQYDSVFSKGPLDVGHCDLIPHEIRVTDAAPVNSAYRRVPPHLVEEVKTLLQGFLDQGLIRRSSSNYASAIVLVKKKSGALRLCIDYRQLNAKCLKDAFPLPRIDESLEAMDGACLFSSLDLAHGYFQVTMHPDSISKTAFRVPWGLYEFTRMPQGLMNSPSTFQRIMEMIFGDLNLSELVLYLDDVLVYSKTVSEHISRLEKVFQRLSQHGLKLNGAKCKLFQPHVSYLGHVVSKDGVAVDPDKIARIRDWPIPSTQVELRSFLGLASYYRKFVSNFATVAGPLHLLTSKTDTSGRKTTKTLEWSEEADAAFTSLKHALCSVPVLTYPRFDHDFVLEVDASLKGLGACLSQIDDDGKLRPVAFASRGLRGAERNYPDFSSFKLELLALKWAVSEKFKAYTLGSHCIVFTDHNPLAHLKTANLGATEHRWVAQLAPFDIEVRYRSGKSNQCADALSRCPANMSSEETASVLHLAMDSTTVPKEIVDCQSPDVTLAPVAVMEGGLTPAILPSYSSEQLAKMQSDDPVLGELCNRWTAGWQPGQSAPNGDLPGFHAWLSEWPNLSERDGVLYRVSNDCVHGPIYQLLVPNVLRVIVLQAVHDQWGHQGVGRTYGLLKARCFWPGMSRHIRDYVRKCFHCTVAKAQSPVVRPPMSHLLAFKPLERLAIDFLKLDRGKGGYEDVLVMTDSFTKFAQAVPCKDQTAPVVAKVLRDHWFGCYGVPVQLHSDQGRNFESELIREVCALYGVQKTRTTPYHPQGNGQTERFNHTLCSLIKSLGVTERRMWPEALPHLMLIYNTTPHSVTGISPYTLMFGRKPVLPVDHLINNTRLNWNEDYVESQSDLISRAQSVAKESLQKAADADKQRWDRRAQAGPIPVGHRVLLKQCAFTGRHKLTNRYGDTSYVVVNCKTDRNIYEIRPAHGGPSKWVNRKLLIADPRPGEPAATIGSDVPPVVETSVCESDTVSPCEPCPVAPRDERVTSRIPISHTVRRSSRANRGTHSNPAHLPMPRF